jgi:membrane-associated phospholipid phosphatase
MPYRKFLFSFLSLLLTVYSSVLSAQNSLQISIKSQSDLIEVSSRQIVGEVNSNHYLKPTALIIPGAFLIYGGLKPVINGIPKLDDKIMSNIRENYPGFHTTAADYLMWAPSASVYVMDAFKVRTRHTFKEHLILDAGSIIVTGALGFGMRKISENIKAYNSENTKFPSGHTANAFRGAEIVHQELKFSHPVLSYSGYLVATGVGLLRIYDKDHFLSEVIAGAGLGILSTKLTYWIFGKIKEKKY